MEQENFREALYEVEYARKKIMKPYFQSIGLTIGQGQPRILYQLSQHEPMTQRELADACYLDAATMSRTVDKLERLGYLYRKEKPGCRRSYHIMLTPDGHKKAKEVSQRLAMVDSVLCAGLSPNDLKTAIQIMKKIAKSCTAIQELDAPAILPENRNSENNE